MEITKEHKQWLVNFNLNHPLVIAGPCSAETEEQVLKIAHELKNSDVSIFRAGIWKPRTRPGGFEGVGEIGLKWLQKAKAETGLLMATEVANANHVKLALGNTIVYSDGRQTNDLIGHRRNSQMNKYQFRNFLERREKLRNYGFCVCKVIDVNTNREM